MKKAIVIGAGIAGCSTAYALAKRGITVTLIERHQNIAMEASGNPVAMLYPKFNTGTSLLSVIAAKGYAYTLALLKQFPATMGLSNACGQIQLATTKLEHENQLALLAKFDQHTNLQLLSASEASEKANIALNFGGLYLADAHWVKPQLLCKALIQSTSIACLASVAAINLKRMGTQWQVILKDNATLAADIVVLCNANEIKQFNECQHIPITPVRGQVNFFQENQLSKQLKNIVCTNHYLSPSIDGLHSFGTSYAPNDLNPTISVEDTKANLRALGKIFPTLSNHIQLSQITGRVAWRSATRDYMPLAGQLIDAEALRKAPPRYNDRPDDLPWLHGLYINAGHGSKGMITAPICAELIANLINHESLIVNNIMAAKLNPSRFLLRDLGLKKIAQQLYNT